MPALICWWFIIGATTDDLTVGAIPNRNPVAPPQLSRNTPIVHVVDPIEPAGCLAFRMDDGITAAYRFRCHLGKAIDFNPPLLGQAWLDGLLRALGVAHRVDVGADLLHNPALFPQRLRDSLPRLIPIHAIELGSCVRNMRGLIQDHGHIEVMALPHREVIGVMSRRDLHSTRTEFRIDIIVGNDLHHAAFDKGMRQLFTDEIFVSIIVRVDGNRDVAQHRLNTRRRDNDVRLVVVERTVADGNELTFIVGVHDLNIGDRGL